MKTKQIKKPHRYVKCSNIRCTTATYNNTHSEMPYIGLCVKWGMIIYTEKPYICEKLGKIRCTTT